MLKTLPIIVLSSRTLYVFMKYNAKALPMSKAMQTAFVALSESSETNVSDITIRTA